MKLNFPIEVLMVTRTSGLPSSTNGCKVIPSDEANTAYRRYLGAREAKNEWLIFLDEDCEILDEDFFTAIDRFDSDVQSGVYQNAQDAGYWAQAFNSICNLWVTQNECFLGGLFCVRKSKFPLHLNFLSTPAWGADEAILCNYFKSVGLSIQLNPNLFIRHHANESVFRFIRRAFQHGRHKELYQIAPDSRAKRNLSFHILKSLHFSWRYIPAYIIHQIALICGMISRLQNKT